MYGPSESAKHDQQAAYVRCSRGLRAAWRDQQGLAAAEKALLALVALAMILMVGRIILNGSRVASDRSVAMLTESSGAPAISWNDSGSPSGGTTLGGGSSGSKGGGFLDGIGGALSDSWGAVKEAGRQVGGFVYGVGTGAVEMVKGTAELVWSVGKMTVGELLDPDTAQAERDKWGQVISVVVEDPGKLWDAITEPIVESWNRGDYGEAIGRGVFEAASTVVGPKGSTGSGPLGRSVARPTMSPGLGMHWMTLQRRVASSMTLAGLATSWMKRPMRAVFRLLDHERSVRVQVACAFRQTLL